MSEIENRDKGRVAWIDLAKALAIFGVIEVHMANAMALPKWTVIPASFGDMGVQLFFILCAYCLCMTWKDKPLTWRWWLKKYMRLAPWYIAGIVIYAAYHAFADDGCLANYTPKNIALNLVFLNGFVPTAQNSIVTGGWSISCIALFVFVFPAIQRLCTQTLIILGVAGCAASAIGYSYFGWSRFFAYCFPLNQFIVFALGVCLYRAKDKVKTSYAVAMVILPFLAVVAALAFFRKYNIFCRHVLCSLSFFGACIILMRANISGGGWRWWWWGILWIGRHSYEIFILHYFAIHLIKRVIVA